MVRRHDSVRDWLADLVRRLTGRMVQTEQLVPAWDRVSPTTGEVERARLDVAYVDDGGRRVYVDVTVVDAATVMQDVERTRSRREGAAAARAEDQKRLRYPGPALVPFAIEALGRPGEAAEALLRSLAPVDLGRRSVVLGAAWQSLSVLVQTGNAELLLSAEKVG